MSRWPRPWALPLVLLCALAYLGSAAHFVLVQHRTCLEHGEWIHEEGLEPADASRQVSAASFDDARLTRTEAQAPVHRADVHCAHVFFRRGLPPPDAVLSAPRAPASSEPARRVDGMPGEPQVAWLHLAPKASPPQR